jgi:hypothetical protein
MRGIALFVILFCSAAVAQAQESYLELLRSDIRAEKTAIVTAVMQFTDEEASAFWSVHREYELERGKLADMRIALIKNYALHYESMTDEKAEELAKRSFELEEKEVKLRKKYYKKVAKELSPIAAARFFQLERQLNLLIGIQIAWELPLIDRAK